MTFDYEIWDVFTHTPFMGNPLAVVFGADALSGAAMQAITREFNLSETVFVLTPRAALHEARLRIFTPGHEMPFAGHPTVGAALALARARNLSGEIRLELNTGLFAVELDGKQARFTNPNLPAERGPAPEPEAIERALSLPTQTLSRGAHRPRRIGAGVDYVFAHASREAVRSASLDHAAFAALDLDEIVGVLLYAHGGHAPDAAYHVRMFAPGAGVAEDPATGSAAAALPGQIEAAGALDEGRQIWIVEQGVEMGRPSRIEVRVDACEGHVRRVAVGGEAVRIASGQLFV